MNEPFDLQAALAGDPVITRNGRTVSDLHFFQNVECTQRLLGVIDGAIMSWCDNGSFYPISSGIHEYDLFMAPKKIKKQVVFYKDAMNGYVYACDPDDHKRNNSDERVACIFVEFEKGQGLL